MTKDKVTEKNNYRNCMFSMVGVIVFLSKSMEKLWLSGMILKLFKVQL